MKIAFVSSEVTPFAKTGGLADVVAALAGYLHRRKHDVCIFMPGYSAMKEQPPVRVVSGLERLPVQLGPHRFQTSILGTELPDSGVRVFLIHCPELYQREGIYTGGDDEHLRFGLLTKATLEACQRVRWGPDVFHCNDWHTGLLPLQLRVQYAHDSIFKLTKTLLTIHNIGYQGVIPADRMPDTGLAHAAHLFYQDDLAGGVINFLKTGILYAGALTTVSPTYAREIQTSEYGMGLDALLRARSSDLIGILNGVDYAQWSPECDEHIPFRYSADNLAGKEENKASLVKSMGLRYVRGVPVMGCVNRLVAQKGIDLIQEVLPDALARRRFYFLALGSGAPEYEAFFTGLQHSFRDRVCYYRGYNNRLAHMIEAGADMFLMPSQYEPCGLNQLYSLKYGTVPIVRRTGGLADSVKLFDPDTGEGTGIVFDDYNSAGLGWAVHTALDLYPNRPLWQQLMLNGMACDYSWDRQGSVYEAVYERLMKM